MYVTQNPRRVSLRSYACRKQSGSQGGVGYVPLMNRLVQQSRGGNGRFLQGRAVQSHPAFPSSRSRRLRIAANTCFGVLEDFDNTREAPASHTS